MFQLDELIRKAFNQVSDFTVIIPKIWQSTLEPNLRQSEVFQQSVLVSDELVGTPGDRVVIPTLADLSTSGMALTEGTDMTPVALSAATSVEIIPSEVGKTVQITRKALDRMMYDGMAQIVDRLGYMMGKYIEDSIGLLYNSAVPGGSAPTSYYPNSHATGTIVVGDVLTVSQIEDAWARFRSSDIPAFDDGLYRLYITPNQYKQLIRDTSVREDLHYSQPQVMLRGEVGILRNFRIIVTTHVATASEGSGGTVPTAKAMAVAPRWAIIAYKRRPQLVVDPTVYDLGRKRNFGITADFAINTLHANYVQVLVTSNS